MKNYYRDFSVHVVEGNDVSIAALSERRNNEIQPPLLTGNVEGTSKRFPGDKRNSVVGSKLAIGRALIKAGEILIREAQKEVQ